MTTSAIVIGSSPLMMLVAMRLAEDADNVIVVCDQSAPGGAWQTTEINGSQDVEVACHVIEPFPGVYELLESRSGIPFEQLDLQPIRVHRTGIQFGYLSRPVLTLSMLRMLFMSIYLRIARMLGCKDVEHDIANYSVKLGSLLRHQTAYLWKKTVMKGPVNGYADFINGLLKNSRALGVSILQDRVRLLESKADHWVVETAAGERIPARSIHCSSSLALNRNIHGQYEAANSLPVSRSAVVVDISIENVVKRHSYVAFWRGQYVRRISRVDSQNVPHGKLRYLFELTESHEKLSPLLSAELKAALVKARIAEEKASLEVVGMVDCSMSRPAFQLQPGKVDDGLYSYYSFGNLAAGIAEYLSFLKTSQVSPSKPSVKRYRAQ